jgi:hypothetical protein
MRRAKKAVNKEVNLQGAKYINQLEIDRINMLNNVVLLFSGWSGDAARDVSL